MASYADSRASFKHRVLEVGLTEAQFGDLDANDLRTFNALAFAVCGNASRNFHPKNVMKEFDAKLQRSLDSRSREILSQHIRQWIFLLLCWRSVCSSACLLAVAFLESMNCRR